MTSCSINTDVFEAWIKQELPPDLSNASVLVMDNAAFHKSERIQGAVEEAGRFIEYLPSYSPDLNPIEHEWAQAKARRKRLGCSADKLFRQSDLQSIYCATAILDGKAESLTSISQVKKLR